MDTFVSDTQLRLRAGEPAPDLTLTNTDGQPIAVSALWRRGPILLPFLRHFGCIFCRERLAQLGQAEERLAQAGLLSVAIGIGEPKHARRYGRLAPATVCLAVPDTSAHLAYGLQRGSVMQLSGPRTVAAALRATANGHFQGMATGDARMLSATFVVGADGLIRFAHYSAYAGDVPAWEAVFQAASVLRSSEPIALRL